MPTAAHRLVRLLRPPTNSEGAVAFMVGQLLSFTTGSSTVPTTATVDFEGQGFATTCLALDSYSDADDVPVGVVSDFAGSSAPEGYLICDGSSISRTTYSALFNAIGTNFGAGDGSTTFNLPDLRGRSSFGLSTVNINSQPNISLNQTGGEMWHDLTTAEIPAHTHTDSGHSHSDSGHGHSDSGHGHAMYDPGHNHGSPDAGQGYVTAASSTIGLVATSTNQAAFQAANTAGSGTGASVDTSKAQITAGNAQITAGAANNQNTGGGNAHNNMPPFIGLNKIIKALSNAPSAGDIVLALANGQDTYIIGRIS